MFRARCKKRAGLLAGLSADTYIYQGQGLGGGGGVLPISQPWLYILGKAEYQSLLTPTVYRKGYTY